MGKLLWNAVRLLSAAVVLLAIVVQSSALAGEGVFDPTRFYAFFTIQSNLIGVVALVWAFRATKSPRRAGATTCSAEPPRPTSPSRSSSSSCSCSDVDVGLQLRVGGRRPAQDLPGHRRPRLDPRSHPARSSATATPCAGSIYPLVWLGFTLVRGAVDGWYPYPFLDPANGGYGMVAVVVIGIIIGFLVLSVAYLWLGNWRASRSPTARPVRASRSPTPAEPPPPPGWERVGPERTRQTALTDPPQPDSGRPPPDRSRLAARLERHRHLVGQAGQELLDDPCRMARGRSTGRR